MGRSCASSPTTAPPANIQTAFILTLTSNSSAAGEMLVIFTSGKTYIYGNVPRKVYDGLLNAGSKGQYMGANVIDVYPFYTPSQRRRK